VMGREIKSSRFHAHVENLCCLFNVSVGEMLNVGRQQAVNFGSVLLEEDVLSISAQSIGFRITTESNAELQGQALAIATGSARKKLDFPGEAEFLGRGVSYCVECDANFYKGGNVAAVGGASAALRGRWPRPLVKTPTPFKYFKYKIRPPLSLKARTQFFSNSDVRWSGCVLFGIAKSNFSQGVAGGLRLGGFTCNHFVQERR